MEPERLRKLVRRDLVVVAMGSLIAIWTYSLVAAVELGSLSELTAGRVQVAVAVLVSVFCIYWWAAGPPEFMRDRVMVLIPVFLIAGPGCSACTTWAAAWWSASCRAPSGSPQRPCSA